MKALNTAVLFLVFNRLDTTQQVFATIRQAKPPKLYIASDGAREANQGEETKVKEVREYIMNNIDWDCEVKTLFRERNFGCKMAVSNAIDWFFEHEEMGIILEDDCLPSQSFFWFCEALLERYKDDLRIWHIAGNNFHFGWKRDTDYSYYYSYYGSIWGWASWRTRWQHYDVDLSTYPEIKRKKYLWDLFGNNAEAEFRIESFDKIKNGMDTWDFQWAYTRLINSGLSIVPLENMIENLGFNEEATHTKTVSKWTILEKEEITFPLVHPSFVIRDKVSDDRFAAHFTTASLFKKLKKWLRNARY